MAQRVKNPPAMEERLETLVQSLGPEDPLEEEIATHSRVLAWEIYGKTRPDSPVPSLQGPCDRSLKSEEP